MLKMQKGTFTSVSEQWKVRVLICSSRRYTPLHRSIQEKRYVIAHLLIDAGADLSAEDINGCTPLHWAVYGNTIQV